MPNACIGVCSYPEDGTDIETLLRRADQAMYAAKSQGCQLWEIYQPEMGQVSQERAKMERELRQALAEGVLQLHFQPQVFSHASHAPAAVWRGVTVALAPPGVGLGGPAALYCSGGRQGPDPSAHHMAAGRSLLPAGAVAQARA